MRVHLQRDIDQLKKKVLTLSTLVEEALYDALVAFKNRDEALARKLIANDQKIDELEVEVENECLKILALHQPVAFDLRYVVSILKMNNDLERVGDLAANIARRGLELKYLGESDLLVHLEIMFERVKKMFKNSLTAFIGLDVSVAQQVCALDDEVDAMHRQLYRLVEEKIKQKPQKTAVYLQFSSLSRYLERIADLATNIAEDVVYMVEGQITRHKPEKKMAEK